jgi:hypothetical protein
MTIPCEKEVVLTTLQVKQAEIAGDVTHIKSRIDNGMSTTIKQIDANLIALKPVIEHHADIIKRVEDIGWLISRYTIVLVLTTMTGLVVWAITKGFVPKI